MKNIGFSPSQLSAVFVGTFISFTLVDVFAEFAYVKFGIPMAVSEAAKICAVGVSGALFYKLMSGEGLGTSVAVDPIRPPWRPLAEIGDPLMGLRLFAFLCVWMTHAALALKPNDAQGSPWGFLTLGCAHQGMAIFFTLSGYLMGKAFACQRYLLNANGVRAFYFNRLIRIVPLYLFAQLVVLLLVRPDLLRFSNWSSLVRLLTFNFYLSPNQEGPIGALWSLSTEMQFYLIVPFLFVLLRSILARRVDSIMSALFILSGGAILRLILFHAGTSWQVHRYTPLFINLDLFLAGLLLNGVVGRTRLRILEGVTCGVWLATAFCLLVTFYIVASAFTWSKWAYLPFTGHTGTSGPGDVLYELGPGLTALFTLVTICCLESAVIAGLRSKDASLPLMRYSGAMKILEYAGIMTYGLYIWHPPVLEAFGRYLVPEQCTLHYFMRNLSIFFFAVFPLAAATYYLVERPFSRLKRVSKPTSA